MIDPIDIIIKSEYDGTDLCLHVWNAPSNGIDNDNSNDNDKEATTGKAEKVQPITIIYHGFLSSGLYPTVLYSVDILLKCNPNMIIVTCNTRGHGKSGGTYGYMPSADIILNDSKQMFHYIYNLYTKNGTSPRKVFFWGSSMGGCIALTIAHTIQQEQEQLELEQKQKQQQQDQQNTTTTTSATSAKKINIDGVILVAPMFKLKVDIIAQYALTFLNYIIPTMSIIPSSSTDLSKQFRDTTKLNHIIQYSENEKKKRNASTTTSTTTTSSTSNTIYVGSAKTCVDLTNNIQTLYTKINVPYLLLIAENDVVIQNDTTLYDISPGTNKTLYTYKDALHGLLCEPQPLYNTIETNIITWITERL